jgi:pimeloyl-ACP methyl ester carboxylesterase
MSSLPQRAPHRHERFRPDIADGFSDLYEDRCVDVDGLRIHLTDWHSPPGAPTVLLLHGLNVQAHTWDPFARDLAGAGRRVLAVDLRGHGRSDWTREGYHVYDFATDVRAVLRELGVERCSVVGHSLGSRVGIVLAGDEPDLVDTLVLSDAGPEFSETAMEFARRVVRSAGDDVRGFDDEDAALAYYQAMHPEWSPEFWHLHVRHQLRRNWAGKLVFRADPDHIWLLENAGPEDDPYVWERLGHVTAPTLILWGQRSPFLTDDIVGRMLDALPDGRLVRTDSGHYIPREAPAEFSRVVREFLDR